MTAERPSDAGVTLIEVVIAVAIGSMIVGAVTAALLSALLNYGSSAARLAESNDAQLLSSWFLPDAQSAGPVIDTGASAGTGCSGASAAGSTNVVALSWSDADGSGTYAAAYRLEPSPAGGSSLVRYFCSPAGAGSPSRVVVGHAVQSANATAIGQAVSLSVTSCASTAGSSSCYSFTLSGMRRTPVGVPSTTTTTAPCMLVSTGVTPSSDALQGGSGHLATPVVVNVGTSGSCSGLSISFNSGNGAQALVLSGGAGAWAVTIGKNDYAWTAGAHPITVSGGAAQAGAANPVPFTVTP